MPTKTVIANQAMALLGQTRFADVDTDTSEKAKWVRELWATSRDEALRAHPWNFATTRKRLASEPGEQANPKQQAVLGLIWAGALSLWVAVGAADATRPYVATSPDGKTWTQRTAGLSKAFALNGIAFDGTTLVAVGAADGTDSYIVTSIDGITWVERAPTVAKNFALNEVVWAGGIALFIAVGGADGADAYLVTSPDGTTWTERANPKNVALNDIVWTGSVAVAVGAVDAATRPYAIYSTDGSTWTQATSGIDSAYALNAIAWSGARLVAVGASTGSSPYTLTSDDGGVAWDVRTNVAKALGLNSVAHGNGFFVAVGVVDTVDDDDTFMVSSRDGETWGERTLEKNVALNAIEHDGASGFLMGGEADGKDAFLLTWAGPPSHGYAYRYELPSDFLRLYDVNDGDKNYKIEEGSLLTAASPTVDIRYTRQVTDPLKFDVLFSRALAVQIAKDMSAATTGNDGLLETLDKYWRRALGNARTTDSQEDGQDPPIENAWVAARRTG